MHVICLAPLPDQSLPAVVGAQRGKLTEVPDMAAAMTTLGQGGELLVVGAEQPLADIFKTLKDGQLSVPVLVLGPANPGVATKAMRLGALEYLTVPLNGRELGALLGKLAPAVKAGEDPIAGDPRTLNILAEARQFAASPATVLLRGESGSGKEVFARYIHRHSPRKEGAFIAVNCAAIPANLLESELFGHEKGAFSGALAKRLGKFQQANGGTLLLDEISEMDLSLQAKLLRAIQERVVDPVGSETPVPVDIRLIATTNRQLEEYVAEGKFREDLYFRLNVVSLELPPLRERMGDILPLATFFASKFAKQNGYPEPKLTTAAQNKLETCYWKGNVRELENTVHRAVLLGHGKAELDAADIVLSPMSLQHMAPAETNANAAISPGGNAQAQMLAAAAAAYTGQGAPGFVPKRLNEAEKDTILATLTYTQGNRQYAADLLGVSLTILREKMVAHGMLD